MVSHLLCLSDVNESPVNLTLSATAVDENSALGTVVGVLSSDDLDGPSNNYHTYSIVAPVSIPFIIGGGDHEKRLLVNGLLDHEANPTLVVVIRATDKGGLFTQKTFKITVDGELNYGHFVPWSVRSKSERSTK